MNDFHIDDSLGYLMHLAATSMCQAIQSQFTTHDHQITMPQWPFLNRLWEEESLTRGDLAHLTLNELEEGQHLNAKVDIAS